MSYFRHLDVLDNLCTLGIWILSYKLSVVTKSSYSLCNLKVCYVCLTSFCLAVKLFRRFVLNSTFVVLVVVCVNSVCVNGVCVNSVCVNSVYVNGVCVNGVCVNGVCVNSFCVNSVCFNSVCVNSVWLLKNIFLSL